MAIAAGGALGAPARYGVGQLLPTTAGAFPWSTFVVNITGSFALGVVLAVLVRRLPGRQLVRPFVATGFLGAYTTYSTFAVETAVLGKDGHAAMAAAYVGASLAVGLAAVTAGMWLAKRAT